MKKKAIYRLVISVLFLTLILFLPITVLADAGDDNPGISAIKEEAKKRNEEKEKEKESIIESNPGLKNLKPEAEKKKEEKKEIESEIEKKPGISAIKEEAKKREEEKQNAENKNASTDKDASADKDAVGETPSDKGKGYTETWNASTDPWTILSGNGGVSNGIFSLGGDTFLKRAVRLLRSTLTVLCLIGMMMSLISIPFISNSAKLKERKEELTHKAVIFAISFAVFPILNFLKLLMDTQFGFR